MDASIEAKLLLFQTLVTALDEKTDSVLEGANASAAEPKGANVETQIDSATPLLWDSNLGQEDAVKLFAKNNVKPNPKTVHGVTPLFSAVVHGSLPCLQVLIQAGASINVSGTGGATPLHLAAARGDVEIFKCLLQAGADPYICDDNGINPLHVALGSLPCLEVLIEAGVSVNVSGRGGATLLHIAASRGDVDILKCLLKAGAHPNKCDDNGIKPIDVARSMNRLKKINSHEIEEILLPLTSPGPLVQPKAKATQRVTQLLSAVSHGSLPLVEALIQAGASVNVGGIGGMTPLHLAAGKGNLEIVKVLLKAGAEPNTCDDNGLQPIHVAASMSHDEPISAEKKRNTLEIVELLLPLTSSTPAVSNLVDGLVQETLSKAAHEKAQVEKPAFQKASDSQRPHLTEVTSEAKERCAKAKKRGADAFRRKDYHEAMYAYTQAIEFDPNDAVLLSNRSLCWLRAGQGELALEDAKTCRSLKPDWAKGYYRQGAALRLLKRFDEAADAFYEGVQLEPENEELQSAFRETIQDRRKFQGNGKKNPTQ